TGPNGFTAPCAPAAGPARPTLLSNPKSTGGVPWVCPLLWIQITVSNGDASILKVEHLSYRYPTGEVALCDVSFSVGLHEVVGLVGPNGAGKTTLLLHLNGLLMGTSAQRETASGGGGSSAVEGQGPKVAPVEVLGMPVIP